jgi:hypothetical protein
MPDIEVLKVVLNVMELAACVTGFLHWKKIRNSHWKYFPFYLAAIVLFEVTGKYLSLTGRGSLNGAMYNYLAIPLQILFFNWLFFREFAGTRIRRLPVLSAGIYLVCWLADSFVINKNPFDWLRSFSYTSGVILLVVLVLAFLYLLITTGNDILFIKSNMLCWVCLGFFIFYFCSLPFFGMGNYLYIKHKNIYMNYAYAIYFLNWIMYSLFIIAFIWGKPKLSFLSS